jgi:hypothetical protein
MAAHGLVGLDEEYEKDDILIPKYRLKIHAIYSNG